MGITNLRGSLENEIACHRGELVELRAQIEQAKKLIEQLPTMIGRAGALQETIEAAEKVIKFRTPEWRSESVKPRRRTAHNNPIPFGNISPTALEILRQAAGKPIRTREVAREVLRHHGVEEPERKLLDRVSNSVGASLAAYEKRSVVKSIRDNIMEWVVIR